MAADDLSKAASTRLYGGWADRTPRDVAALFVDYPGTWWVTGGWALEAFTGVSRPHDDTDASVLLADLPLLRRHLRGALDVWTATDGALCPLLPDDDLMAPAESALPPGCGQVWTRREASEPWEFDILLSPGSAQQWVYKRDLTLRMPMTDALWERDGVVYLQPEIQLLYKAKGLRPKDQLDFDATLPHLDAQRRTWLRAALERTLPGHRWIADLQTDPGPEAGVGR